MGILDKYYNPIDIVEIKEENLEELKRAKPEIKKYRCNHEYHYEKWVHRGRKPGVKDSFHYKEVCSKCGTRRCVERTKEVYEKVKDQKWHYKRKETKN